MIFEHLHQLFNFLNLANKNIVFFKKQLYNANMPSLTTSEILEILPHRYPFLMIDKVMDYTEWTITAIKNFSVNEPYVQGHFPGNHIMPGVMMVEAMAQASTILAFKHLEHAEMLHSFMFGDILFVAADQLRFKKVVYPGDQLVVHSKLTRVARKIFEFESSISVNEIEVCEGKLKAVAGLSIK
jgi:3-hydroxyacyl-[acyl-carrier-protein] dehydratase